MRPRAVFWILACALAAASVWLALPIGTRRSPVSPELQMLVDAARGTRPIEPRLSSFSYGPLRGSRGSAATAEGASPELRIAVAKAEKALAQRSTPDTLHTLGLAYVVVGQIDKSIALLDRASSEKPNDARLLSDLAAAYIVRGRQARLEDVAKAASKAERAVAADAMLPDAVFNRALAFEGLHLQRAARESWERYLQLDGRSAWADEARAHLRAFSAPPASPWTDHLALLNDPARCGNASLVARAVAAFPLRAREHFEDELLPSWADAYVSGARSDAVVRLQCARNVADALAVTGDLLARDAVRAVDRGAGAALRLAAAHQLFRDARRLSDESRFADAEARFRSVSSQLQQLGSGFWIEASFHAAYSAFYQQRYEEVPAALTRLADVAASRGYFAVAGRALRLRGVIAVSQSRLAAALDDYHAAVAQFERIRDFESAAGIETLLVENLQLLGEPRESWDHLARALASLPNASTPTQRYQILWIAIQKCMHDDLSDVALHFQDAFLDNAATWPNGAAIGATTSGYLQRSRVLQRLGDLPSAFRDLAEARRFVADVRDPKLAERWKTEILVAEGELYGRADPGRAVTILTHAIAQLQEARATARLPQMFLLRGRAYLAGGRLDLAGTDFEQGISVFEDQHAMVTGARLRVSHFDESWDLFAEMIQLELQRKNQPGEALSYVERGRARTLLESVNDRGARPLDAGAIAALQAQLPPNVAVLSYVTLRDSLATWVITRQSVTVVQRAIDLHALEAKVDSTRTALLESTDQQNELLTELHDLLLAPVVGAIGADTALVIVPDGPLHAVPFGALIDRRTGRYFVEDRTFGVAPSLATFVELATRIQSRPPRAARMLVVGNPSINRERHPNLADLLGAQQEAVEIAALYPGAELLMQQRATRAEFLRSVVRNDVVHFAGHAVANAEYPWLSRLLFAPESEAGSDTLFAHEIGEQPFRHLQLVVLAACSTAAGSGVRGEGALSLARAFLAAGAPTVIGSLWDVSDPMSQRLFGTFYQRLHAGSGPIGALRDAQLAALHSASPAERQPVNWAGFAAFGAFRAD